MYSFDRDRIAKTAEDLGLEIAFDSDNPGVINTSTGEHMTFSEIFEDFFKGSDFDLEGD